MAPQNPRRVRFGDVCIVEVSLNVECSDDCKANATSMLDEECVNDRTPTTTRKTHDTQGPKTSLQAVRHLQQRGWSTDFKTGSSGAPTDERCHEDKEDDLCSLIDVFRRFDSAKTKTRSLYPRFEKSVELDCRKSSMWARRKGLKQ
eukprot:TRINITY_DN41143_c0_g1_i1.p1 TRINITY_DN41143_c0_g1~~TRINITY_DN41143_c0_g1_i1.p1  ORF type:complete len:146 (-),score=20.47 TRINITY_DN41143_c0_g1_i1:345-782(-)